MTFIEQTYKDLQYALYNADFDVSDLSILTRAEFIKEGIKIEAGILGASHYIKLFKYNNDKYECLITEVFACSKFPCLASTVMTHSITEMEPSISHESFDLKYKFHFYKNSLTNSKKELTEKENTLEQYDKHTCLSLQYLFPKLDGNIGARTVVIISYDENQKTFHSFTIHEYPSEDIVIVNNSTFKIST